MYARNSASQTGVGRLRANLAVQVKNDRDMASAFATGGLRNKCYVPLKRLGVARGDNRKLSVEATAGPGKYSLAHMLVSGTSGHWYLKILSMMMGAKDLDPKHSWVRYGPTVPSQGVFKRVRCEGESSRPILGNGSCKSLKQCHSFRCCPHKLRNREEEEDPDPQRGTLQAMVGAAAVAPWGSPSIPDSALTGYSGTSQSIGY